MTDADLALVPEAIARAYRRDPKRWEAAVRSHIDQLAGKPLPHPLPDHPDRPPVAAVRVILERQRRCPQLTKSGCRCYCAKLDRRPDVWQDCRTCDELPTS